MATEALLVCVSAALPSQGELRGREPSPAEPDPAAEPAEPDAPRAEHGEQGAVPRGAEAVHVSGCGLWQDCVLRGPWTTIPSPHKMQSSLSLLMPCLLLPQYTCHFQDRKLSLSGQSRP